MKIAIDLMGGDLAPNSVIEGVKLYFSSLNSSDNNKSSNNSSNIVINSQNKSNNKETLILVGIRENFEDSFFRKEINFDKNGLFENDLIIIQRVICADYIKMEDKPLNIFQNNTGSNLDFTIVKCIQLVKEKKADIMYSAGNSGAVIFAAINFLRLKTDNYTPAIATFIPSFKDSRSNSNSKSKYSILLDVGASGNKSIVANNLLDIAKIGVEFFINFNNYKTNVVPRVGLLNIGSEEWKGTKEHKIVYGSLKNDPSKSFDFVGNIESDKILFSDVDIIVTDGFTGNIVLKLLESFKNLLGQVMGDKESLSNEIVSRFSYEGTGGAPLLGFEEKIVIGHGKSSAKAIRSGINFCKKYTL